MPQAPAGVQLQVTSPLLVSFSTWATSPVVAPASRLAGGGCTSCTVSAPLEVSGRLSMPLQARRRGEGQDHETQERDLRFIVPGIEASGKACHCLGHPTIHPGCPPRAATSSAALPHNSCVLDSRFIVVSFSSAFDRSNRTKANEIAAHLNDIVRALRPIARPTTQNPPQAVFKRVAISISVGKYGGCAVEKK